MSHRSSAPAHHRIARLVPGAALVRAEGLLLVPVLVLLITNGGAG